MTLIKPFRGLRPAPGRAADVIAPPYDVVSYAEAKSRAAGRPWSFLHVSRPEIDLPEGVDPYAPDVYAKAAENLGRMIAHGVLRRDEAPSYYAYRLTMGDHTQTGLVVTASLAAYETGRIKRHEFTRPDKEDDRVRQIEATNAQTGPVLLAYPRDAEADNLIAALATGKADADVTAEDGVRHELWHCHDPTLISAITRRFEDIPALYIADGHHRSAAAARVGAKRRRPGCEQSSDYFLAVVFPHHALRIMDYNRVVKDLNGLSTQEFLSRLQEKFSVEASASPVKPGAHGEFGLYLAGQWYRLRLAPRYFSTDPVAGLDVSLLSQHILEPILGIIDLRRDQRIDFVGGIRGLMELERRVDSGEMAAAFALYPTSMEELMRVADSGRVMPPKSTWFEPKLADGLVSHVLD
ncbi:MAG: DUF1015 family protein [Rhodocyclaceae bacterium]|nr:DUF1015 family protein [Rhodocyclaceae bacterium]